jgi:hypothetical protein
LIEIKDACSFKPFRLKSGREDAGESSVFVSSGRFFRSGILRIATDHVTPPRIDQYLPRHVFVMRARRFARWRAARRAVHDRDWWRTDDPGVGGCPARRQAAAGRNGDRPHPVTFDKEHYASKHGYAMECRRTCCAS